MNIPSPKNCRSTIEIDLPIPTHEPHYWIGLEAQAGIDPSFQGMITGIKCSLEGHWSYQIAKDSGLDCWISEDQVFPAELGQYKYYRGFRIHAEVRGNDIFYHIYSRKVDLTSIGLKPSPSPIEALIEACAFIDREYPEGC